MRLTYLGAGEGCDFLDNKCIVNGVAQFSEFCVASEQHFSTNRLHEGACNVSTYATALPAGYQYFINNKVGSTDASTDYCPYIESLSNRNCRNTGSTQTTLSSL
mmetsp:Transcript_5880/g.10459  ORF Transcript_5880/g.10459 Transcript_5880/m.10459 type:complete len:104 (-) Transcript_5880:314-625(-)